MNFKMFAIVMIGFSLFSLKGFALGVSSIKVSKIASPSYSNVTYVIESETDSTFRIESSSDQKHAVADGSYKVSLNAPSNVNVAFTVCYGSEECHALQTPIAGRAAILNLKASTASIRWHITEVLDESQLCPDGSLHTPKGDGWGRSHVSIPAGRVVRYCARLEPPRIPAGHVPSRISFQFYDESDQDCGALNISVQQFGGAKMTLSSTYPLSNGGVHFTARSGRTIDPARVAQGLYVVTLTGYPTHCSSYLITWGWQ